MKTTIKLNGKPVEITLTAEQVAEIRNNISDFRNIKTIEDAFEFLGLNYQEWLEKYKDLTEDVLSYMKLTFIAKALNGGKWMDFEDTKEDKFYPYFNASGSASGFSYCACDCGALVSDVVSRHCYKRREIAEYAGKQFLNIYYHYINYQNENNSKHNN